MHVWKRDFTDSAKFEQYINPKIGHWVQYNFKTNTGKNVELL